MKLGKVLMAAKALGKEEELQFGCVFLPPSHRSLRNYEKRLATSQSSPVITYNATILCYLFICSLEGSYPCQVMSGSVSGVDAGTFVVLVKLETPFTSTFHLIQFQGIMIYTSSVKS